jgi:hypothetical protein
MSKKHKHHLAQSSNSSQVSEVHAEEYSIIKHDLVKLLILNLVYLGLVLVLYYSNQKSHFLENWFGKLFNF